MQYYKKHIVSKVMTILLVVALITPSFVKLAHAFADHEHEVCTTTLVEHVHEVNLDCEFYKFKTSEEFYISQIYTDLKPTLKTQKPTPFYYAYLSSHQQLSFSLRGPPLSLT